MVSSIQPGSAAVPEEVESSSGAADEVENTGSDQRIETTAAAAVKCAAGLTGAIVAAPSGVGLLIAAYAGMECGLAVNQALKHYGDR